MPEKIETVIIGGGHAGLTMSYYLKQLNWTIELPGYKYQCDDPDAFAPGREVVRFLDGYADFTRLRCAVEWRSLHWSEHRTPGVICSIQITSRLKLPSWSLPRVLINCP